MEFKVGDTVRLLPYDYKSLGIGDKDLAGKEGQISELEPGQGYFDMCVWVEGHPYWVKKDAIAHAA